MDKSQWAQQMIGLTVVSAYYDVPGRYHVIKFDDESEARFRFMSEIPGTCTIKNCTFSAATQGEICRNPK